MAVKVEIFNTALSVLGEALVIDPDNDTSNEAVRLRAVYNQARDYVLEQAWWSFARTRTRLMPDETAPAFGYTHQYALPSDFVNVMPIKTHNGHNVRYEIESAKLEEGSQAYSRVLLIDHEGPLDIKYIRLITSEAEMSATFATCLAGWLAMRVAVPLSVDAGKVQAAERMYRETRAEAKRLDAQVAPFDAPRQDLMEQVRR